MGNQVRTELNADMCDITGAVEFRHFVADPSWYERYWLEERPPSAWGGIQMAFGCFFRICAALVTGSAFALEQYSSWPAQEDEAGTSMGRHRA